VGAAVGVGKSLDIGGRDSRDRGDAVGRVARQYLGTEPVEADGAVGDVGGVVQPVAASVPTRGARCQSAMRAVRVRYGSMTTSCAPRARASSTRGNMCTLVVARLALQQSTKSLSTTVSGSVPGVWPTAYSQPAAQAESQTVPTRKREAPSAWKSARTTLRLIRPMCPE
jgi:hypothetical protein